MCVSSVKLVDNLSEKSKTTIVVIIIIISSSRSKTKMVSHKNILDIIF